MHDESDISALLWQEPRQPSEAQARPGRLVRLIGLSARPELNGQTGVIATELHPERNRVGVRVGGEVQLLALKLSNIQVYDADHSAWMAAAGDGDVDCVRRGLAAGIPADIADEYGQTALWGAVYNNHGAVVEMLLDAGAQCDIVRAGPNNSQGEATRLIVGATPFDMACQLGHLGLVELLLTRRADPTRKGDGVRNPPIGHAAKYGQLGIAKLLIEHAADVNDTSGAHTPLYGAVNHGTVTHDDPGVWLRMVQLLLEAGAKVDLMAKNQNTTPLYQTARDDDVEVARALIDAKADVEKSPKDLRGSTTLNAASEMGAEMLVRLLIARGANVNSMIISSKCTPLYSAVKQGHVGIAKLLLSAAADANSRDVRGSTPLYESCFVGNVAMARALIDATADVDAAKNSSTPLNLCAEMGNVAVVRLLIEKRADIHRPLDMGASPLWTASKKGHAEVVSALLSAGANVNGPSSGGESPLFVACEDGQSEVARCLIAARAAVSQRTHDGATPLYICVQNAGATGARAGHTECVQVLIGAGARAEDAGALQSILAKFIVSGQWPKMVFLSQAQTVDPNLPPLL